MSGRIDFSYGESSDPVPRLGDAEPYRVLVLGDFSCRAGRGALDPGQLSERRVHAVDPDTLDTVLRHLGASAAVPESPESGDRLSLHGLDDLHPDGLLARVPVLADLLDLHRRLGRPDAAAEAVDEVRRRFGPVAATAAPAEPPASPETEPDDETLRRILGGKGPSSGGDRDHPPASLDRLLRTAVEGDVSPAPEAAQEVGQEIVARALTSRLLEILALPEIRRLEAAWRSLDRLTRSVESGGQLQIHLLDVAREEIEADLATAADSVSQTELFRRLAHHGPGGPDRPGWSVVVLDLAFGPAEPDVRLVGSLGRLGAALRVPVLAGAKPEVAGVAAWQDAADPGAWMRDAEVEARWLRLRRSDPARWVGLTAPRLLLRQPYGPDSDPVDAFPFDEWSGVGHDRSALVWGNAAFGCAEILARRALAGGAEPGDTDIDDLPAVVASGRDGPALVPCAEAFLGEGAVVGLLERGVMTWISDRAIPRARLVRLQSLADPPTAIPGVGG